MEIARVEDCYPIKGHLVLGCSLLVEGVTQREDVRALLGGRIALTIPDGRIYPVQILDMNVQSTFSGSLQVLIGIDAPDGLPEIPVGAIVSQDNLAA